jgi:CDP-diacylglycerol--inositol 3-phosphatidyltransferase
MPNDNNGKRKLPVLLYLPNLLGYARILLAFWGLYESQQHRPIHASWIWVTSASLDLFDGMAARLLDQCSQLGVLLDIAADNLLRTCFWMAAVASTCATSGGRSNITVLLLSTWIISLEWTTMICTQLHAATSSDHWKYCRTNDPWWIQRIFANNFKTPQGVLCIGGLFAAGYMAYAQTQPILVTAIPCFYVFRNVAFLGRGITMMAELWLCGGYLYHVVAKDTKRE